MIIDCLVCCTDLVLNGEARYAVGFIIVGLTVYNIVINLILLIVGPIVYIRLILKWCMQVRRHTKGKTMSYTKERMKMKLSSKMSSAKDFLTSQSVSRSSKPEKNKK